MKEFLRNINIRDVKDEKKLWETVKTLFMDKTKTYSKVTLTLKKKIFLKGETHKVINPFMTEASIICFDLLRNRKQRLKIKNIYSLWTETLYGKRQGSILGLLLFNIVLYYLFYFSEGTNIANYADNTILYSATETQECVVKKL